MPFPKPLQERINALVFTSVQDCQVGAAHASAAAVRGALAEARRLKHTSRVQVLVRELRKRVKASRLARQLRAAGRARA